MEDGKPFVHLHVHSEYSLLDGANKCSDLARTTKEMGMNSVAITDHGVMYGCVEFYKECRKQGVKPIIGCEVYVDPNGYACREGKGQYHLILLAANDEGYHNLVKIVSVANTDGFYYKPRIDHELLAAHSKGIIASSACLGGEIPSQILKGDIEGAERTAQLYRDILGKDNFFLEIQHNSIPEQAIVNKAIVEMARKLDFKLIATNDAHYLKQSDAAWHDILLCVQTKSTVDDPHRYRFTGDDYYFRSPEEMWNLFGAELPDSLINTQEIADRIDFKLELVEDTKHYYLPEFKIPEGETLATHLRKEAGAGLRKRLQNDNPPEEYVKRLEYELDIIEKMDFPGYFCIVSDIITACKSNDIPIGPGRGSAAGSLVAYSLGITDLDPLRFNLIFERFLNPERISMPDIDTDVSDKGRDALISYIVQKYGSDKVAQIVTFGRMMSKQAVADVGRALSIPIPDVRRVTKLIPANPVKSGIRNITEAIEKVPDLKTIYDSEPQLHKMLDIAVHIEGIARQIGEHAAGVVITPKPLAEMVPIKRITKGDKELIVTQYSMDPVQEIGLVKMDFLGLRTLSVLEGALKNIEANDKGKINLNDVPMDDKATFDMLQRGDTLGVFQLESSGMTALVRRMVPDCFEDLVALVALYRPGPLESGMADQYVRCKHGEEPVHYLHPLLEKSMKETYGVILYQEQVMQSASALAGYSMGEADILRKAMGKKKKEVMEKQRVKFMEGAVKNGVPQSQAGDIFDKIEKFAGYGFNKSHSAAYALISYWTAWLKAHYGPEFFASYLTSIVGTKMEELGWYIRSVRDAGFEVLPPDINESKEDFTVVGDVIRLGLSAVAKVGHGAVVAIIESREKAGAFTSFWDFFLKIDTRSVNRGVIENLVKCGAFDSIEKNRAKLMRALPLFLDAASKHQSDVNQASLFSEDDSAGLEPELEECEDFTERQKLDFEKESMGLYISGHPFDHYAKSVMPYVTCPMKELQNWRAPKLPVVTAGLLTSVQEKFTKSGDPMGIASIEDTEGSVELVFFRKKWAVYKPLLNVGALYVVTGEPRVDRGVSILVDDVYAEDEYADKLEPHITVNIEAEELSEDFSRRLFGAFARNRGKYRVMLRLEAEEQTIVAMLKDVKVEPGEKLAAELASVSQSASVCEA